MRRIPAHLDSPLSTILVWYGMVWYGMVSTIFTLHPVPDEIERIPAYTSLVKYLAHLRAQPSVKKCVTYTWHGVVVWLQR